MCSSDLVINIENAVYHKLSTLGFDRIYAENDKPKELVKKDSADDDYDPFYDPKKATPAPVKK